MVVEAHAEPVRMGNLAAMVLVPASPTVLVVFVGMMVVDSNPVVSAQKDRAVLMDSVQERRLLIVQEKPADMIWLEEFVELAHLAKDAEMETVNVTTIVTRETVAQLYRTLEPTQLCVLPRPAVHVRVAIVVVLLMVNVRGQPTVPSILRSEIVQPRGLSWTPVQLSGVLEVFKKDLQFRLRTHGPGMYLQTLMELILLRSPVMDMPLQTQISQ